MQLFVSGMLAMGYLVAALVFLRFWRQTGERLFGYFSLAFFIFACQRSALALTVIAGQDAIWPYSLRLAGFVLFLAAIVDKNVRRRDA